MHQAASSILVFFLSPANWIILLVIASCFSRKASFRKIFRITAVTIFLLFGNQWLLNWYAEKWQPPLLLQSATATFSCGIVAGGFASPDENENGYFNSAADRFIQAVKLYKLGKIKHILVSGGNGKNNKKNFREGGWVKGEFIIMGIPDSVIFVEDRSNNTADNAVYAKQILDSLQLKPPYLLVTSAYHIPRASLIFKKAGVATLPFPCHYTSGKGAFGFASLLPQPHVLADWNTYLKEAAGYLWYSLKKNKR